MIGFKHINPSKTMSEDLLAGFVLFLIALPLCVGIGLGSGAPASAGIIAGVIGGVVGSLLGGAIVNINGPAAGLIVVVLGGINSLSDGDTTLGFKRFLACVVVVGVLQILSGLAKLGKLAFLAPGAVVHGMMAAIGTIIIIKQIPVIMGVKPTAGSLLGIVGEIPSIIQNAILPIAVIGLICLAVLLLWTKVPVKVSRFLPGPLVAVVVGLVASSQFGLVSEHMMDFMGHSFTVGPKFLVPISSDFSTFFTTPLFDDIFSSRSLLVIITVFLIGSLESQLSTLAVDKLDPEKRSSDYDQEFIGKGLVNLLCGLIGGIPVITEIVRSSANIANGAKSPLSNLIHGLMMGAAVFLIPGLLHLIPQTALGAILLLIGWRLAKPAHFAHAWHQGKDAFLAFFVTWAVTIADDLLVGIGCGFVVYVVAQLLKGVSPGLFFKPAISSKNEGQALKVVVNGPLVFSGYLAVVSACTSRPDASEVMLDLAGVTILDQGLKENLTGLENQLRMEGKALKVTWPKLA